MSDVNKKCISYKFPNLNTEKLTVSGFLYEFNGECFWNAIDFINLNEKNVNMIAMVQYGVLCSQSTAAVTPPKSPDDPKSLLQVKNSVQILISCEAPKNYSIC